MKKLIYKKLMIDISSFFLLSILSVGLIVWVIQAVNFLDFVSEDGHSFKIYFFYTFFNLPKVLSKILPFIFFISVFVVLINYEEKNELIIFWGNGITKINFVNTIFYFSIFYLIAQIFFSTVLIPYSQNKARSFIRSSNIDLFPSLIKERKFIDTVSNLTIFVDKKNLDGSFDRIYLKDKVGKDQFQIIYAKKGRIIRKNDKNFLVLTSGSIINNLKKRATIVNFSRTELNLSKYSTKSTTFPKIQELKTSLLLDCVLFLKDNPKLRFENNYLNCKIENFKVVYQELFKRFISPFYLPLLALISTLLILKSKDSYRYNYYKFLFFILGIFSIVVSEISVRYSGVSNLSGIVTTAIPFILFSIIYLVFYFKSDNIN